MDTDNTDAYWMQFALQQAQLAAQCGEVPVGAVLVKDDEIIGAGFNQPISSCDPTAHAEVVALRAAAKCLSNYRLPDTTLYVTIEPCTMCVGALIHARIKRVVFGALEPRAGSIISAQTLLDGEHFNHRIEVTTGVLANQCGEVMQKFFRDRRSARG
jgi:tRNA(adenine34) deaminase